MRYTTMEEYITRTEFERQIAQLREEMKHRQTDEIPAVNVNVASADVIARLDQLEKDLDTRSELWLDTLQEHYNDHKKEFSALRQDMATMKEDIIDAIRKHSGPSTNGH
jgi:hypothetical protein